MDANECFHQDPLERWINTNKAVWRNWQTRKTIGKQPRQDLINRKHREHTNLLQMHFLSWNLPVLGRVEDQEPKPRCSAEKQRQQQRAVRFGLKRWHLVFDMGGHGMVKFPVKRDTEKWVWTFVFFPLFYYY